jgi:hypothetical protein
MHYLNSIIVKDAVPSQVIDPIAKIIVLISVIFRHAKKSF